MKKFYRIIIALGIALTSFIPIHAEETEKEPTPEVVIGSSIEEGQEIKNDDILQFTIEIKNPTNYVGKNFKTKIEVPEDMKLVSGKNEYINDILMPHEEEKYTIALTPKANEKVINEEKNDNSSPNKVDTGDNHQLMLLLVLFGGSGVIILLICKNKKVKKAMIVVLAASLVSGNLDLMAKEKSYDGNLVEQEFSFVLNNEKQVVKIKVVGDFTTQGDGQIKITQKENEYGIYDVTEDSLKLSGTAEDPDGIASIKYIIDDGDQKIKGTANGHEDWKIDTKIPVGTSNVTVICEDILGNESYANITVDHLSDKIDLTDDTWILDEKEIQYFDTAYVDSFVENEKTYVILHKNEKFTNTLVDKEIKSPIYIAPNETFVGGFTGIYQGIIKLNELPLPKEYVYPEGISTYTEDSYTAVVFDTAAYSDIIASDTSIKVEDDDMDGEVLFATLADGTSIMRSDNLRSKPEDDMPYFKYDKKNKKFGVYFDNYVIYDDDGDETTTDDQLVLSGKTEIADINAKAAFEYKPTWDDWLPRQLHFEAGYSAIAEGKLNFNLDKDLKNYVTNINKYLSNGFDNKFKAKLGPIGNLKMQGVSLDDQIYLATIGYSLAGATACGNLDSQAAISYASPVLVFSLIVDLEGNLKVQASASLNYQAYYEASANVQKEGYKGKFGEPKKGNVEHSSAFGMNVDINYVSARSKTQLDKKPGTTVNLKIDGEANSKVGIGLNASMMWMGIMPCVSGISLDLESNLKAKVDAEFDGFKLSKFEAEGSGIQEVTMNAKSDLYLKAGLNDSLFELNFPNDWKLFTVFSQKITGSNKKLQVEGAVYDNKKNKNLILTPGMSVLLINKDKDLEYQKQINDGLFKIDEVLNGEYTLVVLDQGGSTLYEKDITIPYDNEKYEINIYLDEYDENHSNTVDDVKTLVINEGETYRLTNLKDKQSKFYVRSLSDESLFDLASYGVHEFEKTVTGAALNDIILNKNGEDFEEVVLENGGYDDFTVKKGSVLIYALSEHSTSDKLEYIDLNLKFSSEEKAESALYKRRIRAGESLTIDATNMPNDILDSPLVQYNSIPGSVGIEKFIFPDEVGVKDFTNYGTLNIGQYIRIFTCNSGEFTFYFPRYDIGRIYNVKF